MKIFKCVGVSQLCLWWCRRAAHYTNIDWCREQHWKIIPWSCAMLPEGQRPEGNIAQLLGIIFQCWSRLTVDVCFVITQNKCYKFVSSSMMQQHRICIDLPNTAVEPKSRHKCMVSRSLHHDHVMPYSLGTWRCTDETGNIVYFCTSRDAHWSNHVRIIEIVI